MMFSVSCSSSARPPRRLALRRTLKGVLLVLVPDMGYDDLPIADGQTAAARYEAALAHPDPGERARTFADLRAYCARDTLAMVRLREALALLGPNAQT